MISRLPPIEKLKSTQRIDELRVHSIIVLLIFSYYIIVQVSVRAQGVVLRRTFNSLIKCVVLHDKMHEENQRKSYFEFSFKLFDVASTRARGSVVRKHSFGISIS